MHGAMAGGHGPIYLLKRLLCRVGAATSSTFLVEKGGGWNRSIYFSRRRKGKGISNVPLGKEVLAVRAVPCVLAQASHHRHPQPVVSISLGLVLPRASIKKEAHRKTQKSLPCFFLAGGASALSNILEGFICHHGHVQTTWTRSRCLHAMCVTLLTALSVSTCCCCCPAVASSICERGALSFVYPQKTRNCSFLLAHLPSPFLQST